jgi:hypothetical protein
MIILSIKAVSSTFNSIPKNELKTNCGALHEKVRLYNYVTNILLDKIINKRLLIS